MKAEITEMQQLMDKGCREQMEDYLLTHCPESGEETAVYEQLRHKEYSLRRTSTEETEKTKRLLKNSRRNKING